MASTISGDEALLESDDEIDEAESSSLVYGLIGGGLAAFAIFSLAYYYFFYAAAEPASVS